MCAAQDTRMSGRMPCTSHHSCAHRLLRILELDATTIVASVEKEESEGEIDVTGEKSAREEETKMEDIDRWVLLWELVAAARRGGGRRAGQTGLAGVGGRQGGPWPGGAIALLVTALRLVDLKGLPREHTRSSVEQPIATGQQHLVETHSYA